MLNLPTENADFTKEIWELIINSLKLHVYFVYQNYSIKMAKQIISVSENLIAHTELWICD
jgi:hypothetical protein